MSTERTIVSIDTAPQVNDHPALIKKIGRTIYHVHIHFSTTSIETMSDKINFSVNVLSNLTLLDDAILKEMKRNSLLSVQVSLYSMDADIHDAITQVKRSFEKTKKAILKLIESNIPVQISCPIMKSNIDCYNGVVEWGKEHNINVSSDYVIIARYNHTTQNLSKRLSINDVREIISERIASNPHYLELMQKDIEIKKDMSPDDNICSVCHSSICISENGNVYPCAGWQDYILGSINETSLNNIWHKSEKVAYLRNLCRRDFPKCIQCSEKEFCTMCMVRNANEHPLGDPLEVNQYFPFPEQVLPCEAIYSMLLLTFLDVCTST